MEKTESTTEVAIFAGGCFWGVEYYMKQLPGIISIESGYIWRPSGESHLSGSENACHGSRRSRAYRVRYFLRRL